MKKLKSHAFSLVELSLAMAVASVGLLTVFGLLPVGLNSNRISVQQTAAVGFAAAFVADLRATPKTSGSSSCYNLAVPVGNGPSTMPPNAPNASNTKFLTEGGAVLASASSSGTTALYRITVGFLPPSASGSTKAATVARVLITWPALVDPSVTQWPSRFSGSFETMVALDRN